MKQMSLLLVPLLAMSMPVIAQTAPDQSSSDQAFDAGPVPDTQAPPTRRAGGARRFEAADTNGDGKLSRTEAQALPFVSRRFDAIDTNHDGYITRDEMRAEHERMQAARAQRNGSGNTPRPAG